MTNITDKELEIQRLHYIRSTKREATYRKTIITKVINEFKQRPDIPDFILLILAKEINKINDIESSIDLLTETL